MKRGHTYEFFNTPHGIGIGVALIILGIELAGAIADHFSFAHLPLWSATDSCWLVLLGTPVVFGIGVWLVALLGGDR